MKGAPKKGKSRREKNTHLAWKCMRKREERLLQKNEKSYIVEGETAP